MHPLFSLLYFGYAAALVKTLDYFNHLMGAGPIVFSPADRDQFQSRGYVNEWDLCPLCAGILLIEKIRLPGTGEF